MSPSAISWWDCQDHFPEPTCRASWRRVEGQSGMASPEAGPPQRGAKRPVCWACPAVWGWKSPVQPDGGEARAKRKGGTARDRLKEAWNEIAT